MASQLKEVPITGVTEDSDASFVESRLQQAENDRTSIIHDWLLNRAFSRGQQWTRWNSLDLILEKEEAASWRRRPVVNEMFSIVRVLVAKILAQRPVPKVSPVTSDEEDIELARACEDLLAYFWRSEDMDVQSVNFATNLVELGTAFWRVDWNPEAGDDIETEDAGFGIFNVTPKKYKSGAMEVKSVNPFEVYVQPGAKTLKSARWMAQVHMVHVDEVWERWGKSVSGGVSRDSENKWQSDYRGSSSSPQDMARVTEYWERPSKKHKKGRYMLVCQGQVLDQEKELIGGDFPFIHCNFWTDPERFEGITPLTYARSMQRELNVNVGMMLEGRELNTFGKMFVPHGSGITGMTSKAGEVIEYNAVGAPPQWVHGQPVSPQTFAMTNMFRELLRSVTGVHEASLGTASGSASGRSIAFQAEEDNTKLGPTMILFKTCLKNLGKKMLETWKLFASDELTYEVVGENAISEVRALGGSDIRYRDISFQISSALSMNKESRRQELMMMFQVGLIDQRQFAKYMEFGDTAAAYGHKELDRQWARAENTALSDDGEETQAMPWEDHVEHMEVHLTYMKQRKFRTLPPEIRQRYLDHLYQHAAFVQGTGGVPAPQGGPQQGAGGGVPPGETVPPDMGPTTGALNDRELDAVESIRGPSQ